MAPMESVGTLAAQSLIKGVAIDTLATSEALSADELLVANTVAVAIGHSPFLKTKNADEIAAMVVADAQEVVALSLVDDIEVQAKCAAAVRASSDGQFLSSADLAAKVAIYAPLVTANI